MTVELMKHFSDGQIIALAIAATVAYITALVAVVHLTSVALDRWHHTHPHDHRSSP